MSAYYEVRFLPSGTVMKSFGSEFNFYALEDASRIDLQTTPVWCHQCGRIGDGERIESRLPSSG